MPPGLMSRKLYPFRQSSPFLTHGSATDLSVHRVLPVDMHAPCSADARNCSLCAAWEFASFALCLRISFVTQGSATLAEVNAQADGLVVQLYHSACLLFVDLFVIWASAFRRKRISRQAM